jgi:ADP-ribose pyrophosphatase YjhB (NUDIX family)
MKERSIETILEEYFVDGTESFLPHVSINNVVLGYDHPNLKVLVHRMPDQKQWLLPGGYIKYEENLDDSVYRNLKLSGIDNVFLRQIGTFGDAFRIAEYSTKAELEHSKYEDIMRWVSRRFVTVVYYGLVNYHQTKLVNGAISSESLWMDVDNLDNLAGDHASIIVQTRKMLATELQNHPVASSLLPESFTFNELRGLYEAILNRSIDRGTFRRKILKQGIVEKIDKRKDAVGRPSHLFRFNQEMYLKSLSEETKFGF